MNLAHATVPALLRRAELGLLSDARSHLHGHTSQPPAMRRTRILEGHTGCVNRLALSDDGHLLLSGSDDCTLRIWDLSKPYNIKSRAVLAPGHFSNVFGVGFMPDTHNSFVVSAGLDRQVRHTNIEKNASTLWDCHTHMVKTVTPVSSSVFITASEDGTARQFDVREPRSAARSSSNVLVRIMHSHGLLRLMSAAISPLSTNHLLVAAADDPHIRIFDLRCSGTPPTNTTPGSTGHCIQKMAPPHLQDNSPELCVFGLSLSQTNYPTYATYSSDGQQVVASYYEDRVHVFDLNENVAESRNPRRFRPPSLSRKATQIAMWCYIQDVVNAILIKDYTYAIGRANRILELEPQHISTLLFKSHALLRREGSSDMRESLQTLASLTTLVQQHPSRIKDLWNADVPTRSFPFVGESTSCARRAELWLMIFKFMKAKVLCKIISPLIVNRLNGDQCEHHRQRLQQLDVLCHELEKYRDNHCSDSLHQWKMFVHSRALGNADEMAHLLATPAGVQRGQVLSLLRDSFIGGIDDLRGYILGAVNALLIDRGASRETGSDSGVSSSSETEEYAPEHNYGVRLVILEGRRQFSASDAGEGPLWGPKHVCASRSFHGHISLRTDIKEASFYGSKNQIVLSGSDDGHMFMWSARTGELLAKVPGDESIVNCVLGHPTNPMIFCSGLDDTIKVWTPEGDLESVNKPFDVGRMKEDSEIAIKQQAIAWSESF